MADYCSCASSSDGVQVLDLTTPTPAPKVPRARALSLLSRRSSSSSPPAEGRPLTAASPKFPSKSGSGAADDNSDDDFDIRRNWQPSTQLGRTSVEGNNKGRVQARASAASVTSLAGSLRGGVGQGVASGGMTGKGKGKQAAAEDKRYEFALGAGAGIVELLSDSDDGGRPASSRLQQVAESGDDDDCASVDIPNELEGFDSLMVASQTSMMSASQHSLSSPPGSGSGGRIRSRDLSKGDHDQLSTGRDIGAESCGSGQGARTDGSVMLEDNDDDDDEGEEAEDFLMTTKPSPTRERRRGGAMGAAGERGRETGVTDDASLSKDSKALARNEVTANRKRAREEAAAAAKQQKERERAVRKEEKERAKLLEKEKRAAQKERDQQARGNFSHLEIACVMERRFFECPGNARAVAGAANQPSGTEEFMVAAADCVVPGAVWWTRRAHLRGGAATSGPGVMMLHMLVVVMRADLVLEKLEQSGDGRRSGDDDEVFPDLGNYVDRVRSGAPGFSRLVLVLEEAEQELHRRWGSHKTNGNPETKMEDLEDAMSWLLIHKDAETRLTKSSEETGQYLWDLTRALSNMPYKDDVTELHCVSRSKSKAAGSESLDAFEQELADSWVRMLEQIPGISGPKAMEIAKHYCSPRALAAALTDPTVPEKQRAVLLADKMGGTRYEGKRARTVFDLFTQEDGDFVL